MSDSEPRRRSCLGRLLFMILFVISVGLSLAVFRVTQPQDLSDLTNPPKSDRPTGRDMQAVLKNSLDRGYAVTLSEAELNEWLGRTLTTRQAGVLREKAKLDRVWVRLEDKRAEVIMQRNLWGKPFTVSMFLKVSRMEGRHGVVTEIERHGGPYHSDYPNIQQGGRFGSLVVPQGFLLLVMPAYEKLAAIFPEEIDLGFREMARIRIEKNQLVLDPREPLGHEGMPSVF